MADSFRNRRRRGVVLTAAAAVALTSAGFAAAGPAAAEPHPIDHLNAVAEKQIAAAQKLKAGMTPAERKLGSRLVVSARRASDAQLRRDLPKIKDDLTRGKNGGLVVDIHAHVTDALLARLATIGAIVDNASTKVGRVRATVPAKALITIAEWSDVTAIQPADEALTARALSYPAGGAAPGSVTPSTLGAALAAGTGNTQGTVVSEGDKAHGADIARARHGVSGLGVKVCVISDGVDSLAASQRSGDLPAVDVLPGQAGDGNEGTAMLEIIHDLVPGAPLGFATGGRSEASFADNIRALHTAGCKVIVDDLTYVRESPFQDGPSAQAVLDVTAQGALYFTSASNAGNVASGTSGNYEGVFTKAKKSGGAMTGFAHDFDPGKTTQIFEPVTTSQYPGAPAILHWANPLGKASDDYDLYLLDDEGNVVAMSQDVQDGTQDPIEGLMVTEQDLRLVVVKYAGKDRYFQLSTLRGRYRDYANLKAFVSPGMIRGHGAVPAAFSIAAAPAYQSTWPSQPGDPLDGPTGPFPGVFQADQRPEDFTADGPRRMFFTPDGRAKEEVRAKPDFTAADGVSTTISSFNPFFGTSAAAPHAAAIAALVLSGNPGKGADFVRQAFTSTSLDLAPAGWDNRAGGGLLRADLILNKTGAVPQPYVTANEASVVSTSDGDSFLEPGETGTVRVTVTNSGTALARDTSIGLRSDSTGATVTAGSGTIGTLNTGATATVDFTVRLAPEWVNGAELQLAATTTFDGYLSPATTTVVVPTGKRSAPKTFAYAGPALPIPDGDAAGVALPITVSGVGSVAAVQLSIDGTQCSTDRNSTTAGIAHTWVSDLVATLTSPSGRKTMLFKGSGSSGKNLCQTVFDDAAPRLFANATYRDAPFTGAWAPKEPLSVFAGDDADGTWTFTVADPYVGDSGIARAVSLQVTGLEAP